MGSVIVRNLEREIGDQNRVPVEFVTLTFTQIPLGRPCIHIFYYQSITIIIYSILSRISVKLSRISFRLSRISVRLSRISVRLIHSLF